MPLERQMEDSMGVSIGWQPVEAKTRWITPGWRSMMHELLLNHCLYGTLGKKDIPTLLKLGRTQERGNKEPPFDYSEEIHSAFKELARAIRKHGAIVVVYDF